MQTKIIFGRIRALRAKRKAQTLRKRASSLSPHSKGARALRNEARQHEKRVFLAL